MIMKERMRFHWVWVFVLAAALFPGRTGGQSVVHDPVHMGSNLLSFSKELQESIGQTQQFVEIIENGKRQFESLQKIQELTQKVSRYVLLLEEVEDCARMAAYSVRSVAEAVKLVGGGSLHAYEVRSFLSLYTSLLSDINASLRQVQSLVSDFKDGGVDLPSSDRAAAIREQRARLAASQAKVDRARSTLNKEIAYREAMLEDLRSGDVDRVLDAVARIPMSAIPMDPEGKLEMSGKYDLASMHYDLDWDFSPESFVPEVSKTVSENTVKAQYRRISEPATKMFYALSALVGILGAVRVYTRWNLGEDIAKAAFVWFGTSLFLFFVGYVVPMFFKV